MYRWIWWWLNRSRFTWMQWRCVCSGSDCLRTCGCCLMLLECRCRPSQRTLSQMTLWTRTRRILTNACPVRLPFILLYNIPRFISCHTQLVTNTLEILSWLYNWLPWSLIQISMVPGGWILMILVIPLSSCTITNSHLWFWVKWLTVMISVGWISMQFGSCF